jgi:hypothetical protein
MLDVFDIQNSNSSNVFVFNAMHGTNQDAWQTWDVPPNAKMLEMLCIGAGGGGGRPSSGTTNGGGGGASSGISKLLIPAMFLPNRLYILVPAGGRGSTTINTAGSNGQRSLISVAPMTSTSGPFVLSSHISTGAPGGGGSTASTTTTAVSTGLVSLLGFATSIGGLAGTAPGTAAGGVSTTTLNGHILTGGTGGGGRDVANTTGFSGGTVTTSLFGFTSQVIGGRESNRDGEYGYRFSFPFGATGGAGARGVQGSVQGGKGGNGNIGCGGGGGGAGTPSGNGGDGGDGLVIITVWS